MVVERSFLCIHIHVMARLKLMYDFTKSWTLSTNMINHLENLRKYVMKIIWKRKTDIDIRLWFIPFEHDSTKIHQHTERLANHNSSSKEGSILKSKWNKGKRKNKSDVCANRFYEHIEDQKATISEYLDKQFGRCG